MEAERRIPTHVSIIMDGNGRWARERGRERVFGHFEGVESVRACTEASVEAGVRYLSLFAFSEENWGRPGDEVDALMKLMFKSMVGEFDTFMENRVRFVVLGNRSRLSDTLNGAIDDMMARTAANDRLTLILFLSYSGKWDILQAARALAKECAGDPEKIDALDFADIDSHLVTAGIPDPDLIIRTSGSSASATISCGREPTPNSYSAPCCGRISGRRRTSLRSTSMQSGTDGMEKSNNWRIFADY